MKCRRTAPVLAYARTMVQGNCPVFAPGGRNGAKRKKSIRGCGAPHFRSGSRHSRHICLVTLFRAIFRILPYPQDSYCVASAPCPCNIHRMFLRVPLKQHSCNRGRTTKKWKIISKNFTHKTIQKEQPWEKEIIFQFSLSYRISKNQNRISDASQKTVTLSRDLQCII